MARVVLDADVLIAFLDPGDAQHELAVSELRRHVVSGDQFLIAATVYAEVIVRPLQQGADRAVDEFLAAAGVRFIATDRAIARRAAQLRADHHSLKLPDAMSLASALVNDAMLLTFNQKLRRIARQQLDP